MDVSDSIDWNQDLIDEYVDEHPHEESSYLGHSKQEAKKIQVCVNILVKISND